MNTAEVHYNHAWLIWLLFMIGILLHVSLQVDDIARKNNWKRLSVIQTIGVRVAFRSFATMCAFGLLWHYPTIIAKIVGFFGHPLGADETEVLTLPMNNALAGFYGLFLDSAFGYIPGLKSWLPSVDSVTSQLQTAADANVKAGAAIANAQEAAQQPPTEGK